ncbi:MAG: hypothetical protein MR837_01580 [Firmicutes bacterium]|nr:hypothetical protein [Bacillota bacterium]
MKKIIATVLAMVMALALCTTAFAADAITDKDAVASANTGDTVAADVTWNNTGKLLTATKTTPTDLTGGTYWSANGLHYVWDKDTSKFVQITDNDVAVLVKGYDKTTKLVLDKNAVAATCTDAGSLFNVYSTVQGNWSGILVSDVVAYNAKQTKDADKITEPDTKYFFGSNYNNVVAYYKASDIDYSLAAGHVLVKDGTTYGTAKSDVYKCAICGNRYVIGPTVDTGALKSEFYTYDAATVASYANEHGIMLKNILRNNATLYLVEAGKTTTTTTGTTSPKTFDAGIAMYVGMALTSVAGSAVVIGKKKEF